MRKTHVALTVLGSMLVFACSGGTADGQPRYAHEGSALISNVRVIDGLGNDAVEAQDILIVDGKIAGIGDTGSLVAPDGALTIDGAGMTAMPGLVMIPSIHWFFITSKARQPASRLLRSCSSSCGSRLTQVVKTKRS